MTTSHTATITIEGVDRDIVQDTVFVLTRRLDERYQAVMVPGSFVIYHDRDQPYTCRITWQTQSPDLARVSE